MGCLQPAGGRQGGWLRVGVQDEQTTMHVVSIKRLLLILGFASVLLAGPVQAQEEAPTLADLQISIWPEFDRPEVLVIYGGELDADVSLPVLLEIAVPARVGKLHAMAYPDETGRLLDNPSYTTRVEGDLLIVSFEQSTDEFHLEYYDALPVDDEGKRTYTFTYTADYATTELNLDFQQPPTAEGFVVTPTPDAVVVGDVGLTYSLVEAGAVAAGDFREWTFSYVKDDAALTVDSIATVPIEVSDATSTSGGTSDPTVWIFLVAFVALVGVGATGYWLGHRTQAAPRAVPLVQRPKKRRGSGKGLQSVQAKPRPVVEQWTRFCHQCGAELRSDSAFCHACGSQVRDE